MTERDWLLTEAEGVDEPALVSGTWWPKLREPQHGKPINWTHSELLHWFADPPRYDGKPVVDPLDDEQLDEAKKTLPLWSPARFDNNYRAGKNVETVSASVLDLDIPQADLDVFYGQIRAALPGAEWFIYSSFRSKPGAWKNRLIVPYDSPIVAKEHDAAWQRMARMLARAGILVDGKSKDASRAYFVPMIPPCGVYSHAHESGVLFPASYSVARERATQSRQQKLARKETINSPIARGCTDAVERARRYLSKCPAAISGAGGHLTTFVVAARLTRGFGLDENTALTLLATEYNPRCEPPWSDTELARKVSEASQRSQFPMGFLLDRVMP